MSFTDKPTNELTNKFKIGDRVLYTYPLFNPPYYDYEIKHGTIIAINFYVYSIKFDDGKFKECKENTLSFEVNEGKSLISCVPSAPKKDKYNNREYLEREEEILIAKLAFIRERKANLA